MCTELRVVGKTTHLNIYVKYRPNALIFSNKTYDGFSSKCRWAEYSKSQKPISGFAVLGM